MILDQVRVGYFDLLFGYEWKLVKSPSGAYIWHAIDQKDKDLAPDAEDSSLKVPTMMTTADMAMREDPEYNKISRQYHKNPKEFADAFARAWFKLLHRDMGPKKRYIGPEIPKEDLIWQDPIPEGSKDYDIKGVKKLISSSGLNVTEMVEVAWASASTYRNSDMRGGANGARIRLSPQKNWDVNNPDQLNRALKIYENISVKTGASIADVIILAGNLAIEMASGEEVPFFSGRGDAIQELTDEESFAVLEPLADGFRNYQKSEFTVSPEEMLLDKAQLLGLTAPEMTVLVGGLRSLGVGYNKMGIFAKKHQSLDNNFFVNILDMNIEWRPCGSNVFEGKERNTNQKIGLASRVDLAFGSNSQLRALAELYASDGNRKKFIKDFIKAWTKVMNADLFV